MRRVAALMPTRNRAMAAARALATFVGALERCGAAVGAQLAVVDDSDDPTERTLLADLIGSIRAASPSMRIDLIPPSNRPEARTIARPGGGPGAARNRGLAHLRAAAGGHDVLVMFDDDVVFDDEVYRGATLRCRGDILLHEALKACETAGTVIGCDYVGRQDLSILEHARLGHVPDDHDGCVPPSLERQDVEHVAPGGISTAFLVIAGSAATLPDMPEHYNEDYVWLHALAARGHQLRRARERLVHAPPGEVDVTAEGLSFQIFGEIVWLAVLERQRFPVDDAEAMGAAVDEIAGDLRTALKQGLVRSRPAVANVISKVEKRYSRAAAAMKNQEEEPLARDLLHAIRNGLRLCRAL